jgi:hypothetical protein
MEQQQLLVTMALHAWNTQTGRAEKLFGGFSDEALQKEVAPGKNRVIYLFGHLVAIHDAMAATLGIGERLHPGLDKAFVQSPDKSGLDMPAAPVLRQYWTDVHLHLTDLFSGLSGEDWFKRHNAMTDEDFAKEPSRNRLSVLLNRTSHAAYHIGQVALAK